MKIYFVENLLSDMERVVLTPITRFKRWKVNRRQVNTIKAMAGVGLGDFESAADYFNRNEEFGLVLPFNVDSIDRLMDGGIDVGSLTEVFGEAGSGKTQLCLQLALSCALPVDQQGLGGQVVYISTDKDFPVKRIAEMASTRGGHQCLDNILVTKFNTKESLEHFMVHQFPSLLDNRPIKLVIIDSIAGIFRIETNYYQRAKCMRWVANELYRLADLHHFGILVTNQVTSGPKSSKSIACLGPSWNTQVTTKLEVKKTESIVHAENTRVYRKRTLEVVYSPRLLSGKADFVVVESGIQSV